MQKRSCLYHDNFNGVRSSSQVHVKLETKKKNAINANKRT